MQTQKGRTYRTNLCAGILEKGWSTQYMYQVDPLFKTLTEEERERWAAKALPMAQISKTEQEFLEKIKTIKL